MSNLGNRAIMAENIQFYMNKYDKSRQEMCDALGVKYTTFTDWVKGNTYPRIDKIELMANYFGISKSDLVEERVSNASSSVNLANDESMLVNTYRSLNQSGKDKLVERADELYSLGYTLDNDKKEEERLRNLKDA